jgi:hypothetical protein
MPVCRLLDRTGRAMTTGGVVEGAAPTGKLRCSLVGTDAFGPWLVSGKGKGGRERPARGVARG